MDGPRALNCFDELSDFATGNNVSFMVKKINENSCNVVAECNRADCLDVMASYSDQ